MLIPHHLLITTATDSAERGREQRMVKKERQAQNNVRKSANEKNNARSVVVTSHCLSHTNANLINKQIYTIHINSTEQRVYPMKVLSFVQLSQTHQNTTGSTETKNGRRPYAGLYVCICTGSYQTGMPMPTYRNAAKAFN